MIFWSHDLADPASMIVFDAGGALFFAALLWTRLRAVPGGAGEQRATKSILGILVQGIGIALPGIGLRVGAPADPARAIAVAVLMLAAVALFAWAARTLGANWALVARTRAEHRLVTEGPFAFVRHPIYLAMAFFLLGFALATHHGERLAVALPVFLLGTLIRVRYEERLLRDRFGSGYDAYAARVRRFVPGVI